MDVSAGLGCSGLFAPKFEQTAAIAFLGRIMFIGLAALAVLGSAWEVTSLTVCTALPAVVSKRSRFVCVAGVEHSMYSPTFKSLLAER